MELKEYQQNTLKRVKAYLEALKSWRMKNEKVVAAAGKEAALDVPLKAWEEIGGKNYLSRKNGIGEALPNFCLKIPTGGDWRGVAELLPENSDRRRQDAVGSAHG
jgi:type III restriction enzyme